MNDILPHQKEEPRPAVPETVDPIRIQLQELITEEQIAIQALDAVELTLKKINIRREMLIQQLSGIKRAQKELTSLQSRLVLLKNPD